MNVFPGADSHWTTWDSKSHFTNLGGRYTMRRSLCLKGTRLFGKWESTQRYDSNCKKRRAGPPIRVRVALQTDMVT